MTFIIGRKYLKLPFSAPGKFQNISIERTQSMSTLHIMFFDVKCILGRTNGSKNQLLPSKDLKLMNKMQNWH